MCSFDWAMAFYMCLESPVIWFSFLWVVDTCPSAHVVLLVSEVGRLASLASLGSLVARFHCGVHSWLRARLYLCVRGGAPREPRFARLAQRPLSMFVSHANTSHTTHTYTHAHSTIRHTYTHLHTCTHTHNILHTCTHALAHTTYYTHTHT